MKIQDVHSDSVLFMAKSGSRAYGLATPTSDVDIRGIFVAPKDVFFGLNVPDQASDDTNDTTLYELKRFVELLGNQNPNITELLAIPKDCIIKQHPLYDMILRNKEKFITTKIRDTFGGYAISQIKKSRGLKKKIVNPIDKVKLTPIDFCFTPLANGDTVPLKTFLANASMDDKRCGLTNLNHVKDGYALFYDYVTHLWKDSFFRGINIDTSNSLRLSSIPIGFNMVATVFYNKDSYTKYCRDYKEYWEWVANRNPARYEKNMEIGKNYDSKNIMHCIRLLRMAEEMLRTGELNVRRADRDNLLAIRNGEFEYDYLLDYAEDKIKLLDELVPISPLPKEVDMELLNNLLVNIRDGFYEE